MKIKKYSLYIIVIFIVVTALGLVKFLPLKNTQEQERPFIASSALNLANEKCTEDTSNVYMTECSINLLDRVASEREWKQRKFEVIKHPQVNTNELGPNLGDIQKKIRDWRDGFEKARDNQCEAMLAFSGGSGISYGIALCKIDVELAAINELNELYYTTILKDIYDSEGISDFEPTDSDIEEIIKVNATSRGCVWADDEACK